MWHVHVMFELPVASNPENPNYILFRTGKAELKIFPVARQVRKISLNQYCHRCLFFPCNMGECVTNSTKVGKLSLLKFHKNKNIINFNFFMSFSTIL